MSFADIFSDNPLCRLLGIRYPICQAGMYQVAYGPLAAAVSNAGGLGVIGSAYMDPARLREEIRIAKSETDKPFGVDILFAKVAGGGATIDAYEREVQAHIDVTFDEGVPVIVSRPWRSRSHCAPGARRRHGRDVRGRQCSTGAGRRALGRGRGHRLRSGRRRTCRPDWHDRLGAARRGSGPHSRGRGGRLGRWTWTCCGPGLGCCRRLDGDPLHRHGGSARTRELQAPHHGNRRGRHRHHARPFGQAEPDDRQ